MNKIELIEQLEGRDGGDCWKRKWELIRLIEKLSLTRFAFSAFQNNIYLICIYKASVVLPNIHVSSKKLEYINVIVRKTFNCNYAV